MPSDSPTKDASNAGGTVIITGANGSLAIWFVEALLRNYSSHFAILAVRDDAEDDLNTAKLRKIINSVENAKVTIEKVDLASLTSVRSFADSVMKRVSDGTIQPISAIVCNAFNWSLTGQQNSVDGYDLSFQVTHLSHFLLVLKLLGSVNKENGRIVFLGSDAHDEDNLNAFRTLGASLQGNLEDLVNPTADKPGDELPRGFQRYGNSKLATIMCMHLLNRKLLQDPELKHITALAMDPRGIPASRAFGNVPFTFKATMYIFAHFIVPIIRPFQQGLNTPADAGQELLRLSMGPEGQGVRGYYVRLQPKESSMASLDEQRQEQVWAACVKWVRLDPSETVLKL